MFNMGTRVGQYIMFGLLYLVLYHFIGFELTVIFGIGTILGELQFMQQKEKEEKQSESPDDYMP